MCEKEETNLTYEGDLQLLNVGEEFGGHED